MRIEELLDAVTPAAAAPPSVHAIETEIGRRQRRRHRLTTLAAGTFVVLGLGFGATRSSSENRIDTVVDAPTTTAAEGPASTTSTTSDPATTTESEPALTPSETRWFLTPPEGLEIRNLQDNQLAWGLAQDQADGVSGVVTVSKQPATEGAVAVYYLDYIGIEITDGPEQFSETFTDIEIDGTTIRIGSDSNRNSVKAFKQSDPGVIVVTGWGFTEDEVLTTATSAEVSASEINLDGLDMAGVDVTPPLQNIPTDHSNSMSWIEPDGVQATLTMWPGSLATGLLSPAPGTEREVATVRNNDAVFVRANPGQEAATLLWAEDGYLFALTTGSEDPAFNSDELIDIATSLERTLQPELAERLGDPFMINQAETVARWLDNDPLPPGWDPAPLIHAIPGNQASVASFIHQYASCAWGSEWLEAAQNGEVERRQTAFDALSNRASWSAVAANFEATAETDGANKSLDLWITRFDAENELLADAQTPDEIEAAGRPVACGGFSNPS